jgi:hypothetical protein
MAHAPHPAPASGQPVAPRMGEFARLSGVLFDPKPAFADIALRPRWWVPLLLIVIASVAYMTAYSQRVGWDRFMRQTLESMPRMQELSAGERERIIEMQTRGASISGYVGALVAVPATALVIASVLLFVSNFLLGAALRFRPVFGVTCYALLPALISTLLTILVLFLKDPDDFDLRNPTAFNVGAFMDPLTTPKWLVSAGSSLDLFSIWTVLLLAVGLSVAAPRLSWSKALIGVSVPWILWIVVKSALAGLFG